MVAAGAGGGEPSPETCGAIRHAVTALVVSIIGVPCTCQRGADACGYETAASLPGGDPFHCICPMTVFQRMAAVALVGKAGLWG